MRRQRQHPDTDDKGAAALSQMSFTDKTVSFFKRFAFLFFLREIAI